MIIADSIMLMAQSVSSSGEVLNMLSENGNLEVRMAVADNTSTPVETMMTLAKDDNADLRYQIASNHNICKTVLELLLEDENPYVAHRAQKTISTLQGHCLLDLRPMLYLVPKNSKIVAL